MSRSALVLLLAALASAVIGCTHAEAKPDDALASGADAGVPASAPDAGNAAGLATAPHLFGGGHSPLAALSGRLLPPAELGQSRTAVIGCAAKPDEPPEVTRSLPPEEKVEATAMSTGLVLSHELPHACCLSAKITTQVEGARVTVIETLEGKACRCRCGSTLRAAVALAKGTYAVEVKTVEPERTRTAWTGEVTVK